MPLSVNVRVLAWFLCVVPLLGTVACGRSPEPAAPASTQARADNLLIVTIDTLRADAVGAYGHSAARTPALEASHDAACASTRRSRRRRSR